MCTHSKDKNVFFWSSIFKFTEQHIWPAPKSKNACFGLSISIFTKHHVRQTNTDLYYLSLDNTSDSEGPVNSTMITTSTGIENNTKATKDSVVTITTIMLWENNETWYDTNEEYDSWHYAAETMDNYQEWINPFTVVGVITMTNPIIKNIDPYIHQGDEHPNSLKPTILTPNSGWEFLHSMLYKIICFMLLWIFKAKVTTCKTIKYVLEILSKAMVVGNFHIIFAQANNLVIKNGIVNQEDTVVNTRSWNANIWWNAPLLIIQTKI